MKKAGARCVEPGGGGNSRDPQALPRQRAARELAGILLKLQVCLALHKSSVPPPKKNVCKLNFYKLDLIYRIGTASYLRHLFRRLS